MAVQWDTINFGELNKAGLTAVQEQHCQLGTAALSHDVRPTRPSSLLALLFFDGSFLLAAPFRASLRQRSTPSNGQSSASTQVTT